MEVINIKTFIYFVLGLIAGFLAGYVVGARAFVAKEAEATFVQHVDICHATPPDTAANGWVQNSPSIPQLVAHITQHDADIIPPFGQYPGKNWDEEGQAIYRNGCVVPPPPDVCENIEGLQEETPDNMYNDEGYCDCQEGYHREYEEEYEEEGDGDSFSCVPDEEVPPEEPPVEEPRPTTEALAPQCTDLTTILLPANFHVTRRGGEADLKWFQTQGNSVNIYFKEVGADSWQHSVADLPAVVGEFPNNYNEFTVGMLNPALGYIFGLEQKTGCGGGQLVTAVVEDGPLSVTFPFSYWIWSN